MLESIGLWRELERTFEADLEIALAGGLLVAETEAQMRDVERKAQLERAHGLDVELLDANELRSIAPYVSDRMIGGAFCPHEGKINPLLAAPAFRARRERRRRQDMCGNDGSRPQERSATDLSSTTSRRRDHSPAGRQLRRRQRRPRRRDARA